VKIGHHRGTTVQLPFIALRIYCGSLLGDPKQETTFMDVHLAALLMVGIALSYVLFRALWI
jgi:hypothetical protein